MDATLKAGSPGSTTWPTGAATARAPETEELRRTGDWDHGVTPAAFNRLLDPVCEMSQELSFALGCSCLKTFRSGLALVTFTLPDLWGLSGLRGSQAAKVIKVKVIGCLRLRSELLKHVQELPFALSLRTFGCSDGHHARWWRRSCGLRCSS